MDPIDTGGTTDATDVDVDGLLSSTESASEGIPMDDPAPEAPEPAAAQPEVHEIEWNGKKVQGTLEQLKKWAQQGYDYPQKMQALKAQASELEQKYQPYNQMDQFVRENPEWWAHVQQAWQQRQNQAAESKLDPTNPLTKEVLELRNKLGEFEQFKNEQLNEKKQQTLEKQDQELNAEIKSMREKYSHLDWASVNEQGYDLETQVMAYANQRGIGNFTDAFKAYNLDKIASISIEKGKEAASHEVRKNTKLGLLGKSSTPTRGEITPYQKGKSDSALLNEALNELGIA